MERIQEILTDRWRRLAGSERGGRLGCDRYRKKMGFTNLFRDRLTIGLKSCDMSFDGFHCPRPTLIDSSAAREAPRQRRDGHKVAAVRLGLDHDRVGTHHVHPVTARRAGHLE
jgi:hypothetical protein